MERQRHRFQELDKKSNDELLEIIAGLRAECDEKEKACTKLQEEVQAAQNEIAETKEARSSKRTEYAETHAIFPLAENTHFSLKRVEELEGKLKAIQETKEDRERKRAIMKEEIQILEADHKRLQENHSALLENLANVKSQVDLAAKKVPHSSRPLSRREADEHLDDLVRQYLPERLFKTRRRRDNQ